MEILVVGAGVSGLTTAVSLAEDGYTVRVRSERSPGGTNSCVAGAIWGPYFTKDERVPMWSRATKSMLSRLAGLDGTGVRLVHGLEASRRAIVPPVWAASMDDFRLCERAELPRGFASGWWYTAPVVDMPVYLSYLEDRLRKAGGEIELRTVASLDDALIDAPIVVNCTGASARELVPDLAVVPNRGQLVVVHNPGIDRFFIEHDESPTPTYFLPHGTGRVVLGGSSEPGRCDLNPDRQMSLAIQRRCAIVEPKLAGATVIEERVGLRPFRPRVRLERNKVGQRHVVHNYGHGGSGVTLSWGCARDVVALIRRLPRR